MTDTAPWHFNLIAGAAILWHLVGGADYVMTQLQTPQYLALFTEAQIAYFTDLPAWVNAAWAAGVWVGLLGALLLWMGERLAVLPLAIGFAGMLVATIWLSVMSNPPMAAVTGPVGLYIMWGAVLISFLFYLYARTQRQIGVLD